MGPATISIQEELAQAHNRVAEMEASVKAAALVLAKARREVLYRDLRLRAARLGIAHWALGLAGGSAVALLASILAIMVFGTSVTVLLLLVFMAYAVVWGGAFWLLRAEVGENEQLVAQVRATMLDAAQLRKAQAAQRLSSDHSAAERSRCHLNSVLQVANSEATRRQTETNRLLGIDGGRLYPDEFERYVAEIFRHLGYVAEVTGKSGDQGVDILAIRGPVRVAVQAKRYMGSVSNSAVQEVYAGMAHRRCHRCVVVTSGDFTNSALSLAESTGCLLVGKDRLAALIRGEMGL
jgi:HJR/Mrr/RecB family endonuclease